MKKLMPITVGIYGVVSMGFAFSNADLPFKVLVIFLGLMCVFLVQMIGLAVTINMLPKLGSKIINTDFGKIKINIYKVGNSTFRYTKCKVFEYAKLPFPIWKESFETDVHGTATSLIDITNEAISRYQHHKNSTTKMIKEFEEWKP